MHNSSLVARGRPGLAASLAVVGWLVAVGCGVGAMLVRVVNPAPIPPNTFHLGDSGIVAFVVQALAFASVGAVLVQRRPDNAVGKVLVLAGASYAVAMLAAVLTFIAETEAPGGEAASVGAWFGVVSSFVGAASLPYLAFIFPTGRAQNARWDRFRLLLLATCTAVGLMLATQPGPIQLFPGIKIRWASDRTCASWSGNESCFSSRAPAGWPSAGWPPSR